MAEPKLYLYRLDVEYPDGMEYWEFHGKFVYDSIENAPPWMRPEIKRSLENPTLDSNAWIEGGVIVVSIPPFRRAMFSQTNAKKRAFRLERFGAKVKVVRSLPVEWPEPSD